MIRSMTAFAREEMNVDWGTAAWELRSVNFRYLDVSTRLPEDLRRLETPIRERVSARLGRGKVECALRVQLRSSEMSDLTVNKPLAEKVAAAGREIEALLPDSAPLGAVDILRWPGVVEATPPDVEVVSATVLTSLDEALDSLVGMREREGEKIAELIAQRCEQVASTVREVREALPQIQQNMRERIATRVEEVSEQLDNDRLEQEMVIFANKMDVSEEIDRLNAHVSEVCRMLGESKPAGRRLDFLMQEMNREANTLGSKSVDVRMTNASVDLKVLIEQMREQIQNIE